MKTDIKKILASKTKQALSSNILSAEAIRQNIVILPELKNLIPALAKDELEQLENNILQHGCQTPIQLWQASKQLIGLEADKPDDIAYILIDGHNRHSICKRHNLNFEVYMLSFPSLKEAKDYMINLQLGRRNLSLSQISYFRGLRYNNEKTDKSENLKQFHSKGHFDLSSETASSDGTLLSKGQNDPSEISTAERLSKEYNVSPKTIKRDAEFAKGLEKLDVDFRNNILSGKAKIDKGLIQKVAKIQVVDSPIEGVEQLMELVNPQEESVADTTNTSSVIQEKATELINISKKFAKTNSKTDLQQMIELAQYTLLFME
ncbi:MAG: hypothetical protein QE277_05980 [Flectobacillus sp.]|nr:hypothetical protein [Flectobacillus sp.]